MLPVVHHQEEITARKTLFIDARNMGYMKDRTHRELDPDTDIKKITDTFEAFRRGEDVAEKGFATVATTADIAKEGFVLTPDAM